MIDRTFSNTLAIADIAPKAATQLPERAEGGFGEALAGAHTVHDRRESHAPNHSRREWAQGDRSTERTRGHDRADEVRTDDATVDDTRGDDGDTEAKAPTGPTGRATEGDDDATVDATADAARAGATEMTSEAGSNDGEATTGQAAAAGTLAVAAAPVSTDLDAIIVPTRGAAAAATDAVDAAIRLAIDADAAVTVDGDVAVDAEARLITAQGAEDAETGDVEAGPTRPATSVPATTSGPSPVQAEAGDTVQPGAATGRPAAAPVQLGATVEVDEVAGDAPVVTAKVTQQVAAAATTEVAAGTKADGAAQLVQAAVVTAEGDADASAAADVAPTVTLKAGTLGAADDAAPAAAMAEDEAEAAPAAVANRQATTPAATLAQVAAQARAKGAEAAAEEGGEAAAPKLEPLSTTQGQPLTAATRDAQLATGVRVREGLLPGGGLQETIDGIADQLATRLRLSQAAGGSQVQLSLKPRELGEVTVQMNVRDGVVAATILVDKVDTLRTMQANIEELKRSLENQGLAIQEFSVDVRGDTGAGGANARAAADLRHSATSTSTGSASSLAGAAAVIPGLSGDREVDPDSLHDGDVSVLA